MGFLGVRDRGLPHADAFNSPDGIRGALRQVVLGRELLFQFP